MNLGEVLLLVALVGMGVWGLFITIREVLDPSEEVTIDE